MTAVTTPAAGATSGGPTAGAAGWDSSNNGGNKHSKGTREFSTVDAHITN